MLRTVITTAIIALSASVASAELQGCGPDINFGLDRQINTSHSDSITDGLEFHEGSSGATYEDAIGQERGNSIGLNIGLTWTIGKKKACETQNAIARDLQIREIWAAEAQSRQETAAAEEAEINTLMQKIEFCTTTAQTYEDLGKSVPQSVKNVCGDLI